MNRIEFLRIIEETDEKLAQQNISLHVRPIAAFKEMAGNYEGPIGGHGIDPKDFPEHVGPNLIEKINNWYRERYGDRINMPTTLGRIPFLIRGQIYTARIQLTYGAPRVNPLEFIDGMTDSMKQSLSPEELRYFTEHWVMGYELVYEIEDMLGTGSLGHYNPEAQELIKRAIEDRNDAVECLQGPHPRTNISCFHSQQHAEKMMKATLIEKSGATLSYVRGIGHRMNDLMADCLRVTPDFTNITSDVALLANIPMSIRYDVAAVGNSIAVETFFAAFRVGGISAVQISGHQRRLGTTSFSIS